MALLVQKYGGTSVGSLERISHVADKIIADVNAGNQVVVVLSAMSGETDRLINLAKSITPQPPSREYDMLISTGEQVTIALLAIALQNKGQKACSFNGAQVKILTDSFHTKARIQSIDAEHLSDKINQGNVVVVAGFQGVDEKNNITTLGRGGSDTTAVAIAAAIKADECQIFTDVDGVYTTDPRVVRKARRLDAISFDETLEMASSGSKVLQLRAVEFASKYQVPLRVLSSFEPGSGTLITTEEAIMEKPIISVVAFNRDEAKITVQGVSDMPGIAYKILGPVAEANIEIDVIVQNIGTNGKTDFTFTVHSNDFEKAMEILKKTTPELGATKVFGDANIAKVALVGIGMRSHAGVAAKMFKTLADENINIQMISTSEIKITVVVDQKYMELCVRALHSAFGLDKAAVVAE